MKYILITVAWNEENFIEKTIKSLCAQTILPIKWIIVNDGSTDRTEEIVNKYAKENSWINVISLAPHSTHGFASKAKGFMLAYDSVKESDFDLIGNLDADISFDPDYFEYLIDKFSKYADLGVAGTPFVEDGKHYDYRFTSIEHVSGACQIFRKECFEQIGGYLPINEGGIDWVAVTTARMMGWKTQTFTERVCYHHRKIGTANKSLLQGIFHYGKKNYFLGYHPLWMIARAVYQAKKPPLFIGAFFLMLGYFWGFLTIRKKPISNELISFNRKEQMKRLKNILSKLIKLKKNT